MCVLALEDGDIGARCPGLHGRSERAAAQLSSALCEAEGHLHARGALGRRHSSLRHGERSLQRDLSRVTPSQRLGAVALWVSMTLCGCVSHYQPPTAHDPHAVVKLRRSYEVTPGQSLRERAFVGEDQAFESEVPVAIAKTTRTDAILVHPTRAQLRIEASFYHPELRHVQETYYEQEPYSATESYSCGTGSSPRTCTRSVTRYRSVSRTRWVNKTVEVSDGSCSGALGISPAAGHVYLLQFTYRDTGACALVCYEQNPEK